MKGTALGLYQVDNHIRCNIHIFQDVTSLGLKAPTVQYIYCTGSNAWVKLL